MWADPNYYWLMIEGASSPVATTIATTTPWLLAAFSGVLWRRDRSDVSLGAPNDNRGRSTVNSGTRLKIMVSPVRVRVPPLLFPVRQLRKKRTKRISRPYIHIKRIERAHRARDMMIPRDC
jgi:hypothetical protein